MNAGDLVYVVREQGVPLKERMFYGVVKHAGENTSLVAKLVVEVGFGVTGTGLQASLGETYWVRNRQVFEVGPITAPPTGSDPAPALRAVA